MNGFVYILESKSSGRYYIGSSTDINIRLNYHNNNLVTSTKNRGPWIIKYSQAYPSITIARKIENKIKKLKSRKIIDKIISEQNIAIRGVA